jgi:hypothetical protein
MALNAPIGFPSYYPRDTRSLLERFHPGVGFHSLLAAPNVVTSEQEALYANVQVAVHQAGHTIFLQHRNRWPYLLKEEYEALLLDVMVPRCSLIIADCDSPDQLSGQILVRGYDSGKRIVLFGDRAYNRSRHINSVLGRRNNHQPGQVALLSYQRPDHLHASLYHLLKHTHYWPNQRQP